MSQSGDNGRDIYDDCQDYEDQINALLKENARLREDAGIIARFIIGWWPGLEDALSWPVDEPFEDDKRYAAAKRIAALLDPAVK